MFETVELGRTASKEEFKRRAIELRPRLLIAQQRLRRANFPVIVVFQGVDGAGKAGTANMLWEWLDPRRIAVRAYEDPTQEERDRPPFWRYWRDLPPAGQIGMFLSAWYSQPFMQKAYGGNRYEYDSRLEEIAWFERTLADNGALIVKFWMHLGKDAQKRRFEEMSADPLEAWRVGDKEWQHLEKYDSFIEAAEHLIMRTSAGHARWHLVEGTCDRYRALHVADKLLESIENQLHTVARMRAAPKQISLEAFDETQADLKAFVMDDNEIAEASGVDPELAAAGVAEAGADVEQDEDYVGDVTIDVPPTPTVLGLLDMKSKLPKDAYNAQLQNLQAKLRLLAREARARKLSTILVFEGVDAAGKGGAIRRITSSLDARACQVIPIAAPTDEEKVHHYLWRFWRHLPRTGRVTVFDRSWYGRVLVERLEGFATEEEWGRAYGEINHFEQQLTDAGTVLLKFWLHLTPAEQLKRFHARQETPWKRWKLTDEDWRNRARWHEYEVATHDMVERTSTRYAPWHLVEGNDKKFARIKVLRTVVEALEKALPDVVMPEASSPPAPPEPSVSADLPDGEEATEA